MRRVAIIIDSLKIGGAQRLVSAFASNASMHGIEPVIINLRDGSPSAILDVVLAAGVKVITVPSYSLFNIKRLRWLVSFLRESKIDVVQTHLMYANILGSTAAHLANLPVICTLHSTHVKSGWRGRILKRLEDYCLQKFATRILAVGDMVSTAHQGHYGDRVVDVIPNGIPEIGDVSVSDRARLRSELGVNGHPLIITVGRFSTSKGYQDMIEAFGLLQQKNLKSKLLMVGSGSTQDSIRSQIEKLDLGHAVILAGERHDIPQLLASSDVFASSSHREGLPLSVLEAMMAGLPVVATAVGDIPNVVTRDTGVIVPPHRPEMLAAALEELLTNPNKRQEMGKAARDRAVQEYSVDVWMKRHVKLYEDVIHSQGRQPVS
jgi:glycosyltransferase involved in cell wall biosynthesis